MRSKKHFNDGYEQSQGRKPYGFYAENPTLPYGGGDELHKDGRGDIKGPSKPINPNAVKPKPKTGPSKENPNYPPNLKDTPGDSIHAVPGSKKPNLQPKPKPDPKSPKEPGNRAKEDYLKKGSSAPKSPDTKPKFPNPKLPIDNKNKNEYNKKNDKPPRDNPPAGGVKPKPKKPTGPTPVGASVELAKK